MDIISSYSIYLYIILIAAIVALLVVLLMRLLKFTKHLNKLNPKFKHITKGLEMTNKKAERIAQSKDNYTFFLSILTLLGLAKDIDRDRKRSNTLGSSVVHAALKNADKLRSIKF